MRLLIMFMLIAHTIHGEMVAQRDKRLICPLLVGTNTKHHWEIEKVGKLVEHSLKSFF